jgi:hypothetical protein
VENRRGNRGEGRREKGEGMQKKENMWSEKDFEETEETK